MKRHHKGTLVLIYGKRYAYKNHLAFIHCFLQKENYYECNIINSNHTEPFIIGGYEHEDLLVINNGNLVKLIIT